MGVLCWSEAVLARVGGGRGRKDSTTSGTPPRSEACRRHPMLLLGALLLGALLLGAALLGAHLRDWCVARLLVTPACSLPCCR